MLKLDKIFLVILIFAFAGVSYSQTEDSVVNEIVLYYFEVDTSYFIPGQDNFNLIQASEKDDLVGMEILLRKGVDVNTRTFDGVTPLMYASESGNVEAATMLLDHGADPDAVPDNGITALISVAKTSSYDLSLLLLDWGASVDMTDEHGFSSLMYAVLYNYSDLTELYLSYGADLTKRDLFGSDALIIASYYGAYESARILLDYGADVNTTDNYGFTPLIIASQQGHYDLVWLFIENGAEILRKNQSGYDALSMSVLKGHIDITELLIENGADVNNDVNKGIHPIDLAKKQNDQEMINLLKENKARSNRMPNFNSAKIGFGITSNTQDFMVGTGFGLMDSRYGLEVYGKIYLRPVAIRVLLPETDEWYYQYWERRTFVSGSLNKKINIYSNDETRLGVFLGMGVGYTWGSYRGADRKPRPATFLNPAGGIYWKSKSIGIDFNYEYADLKIHDFSKHWITLVVTFYFDLGRKKLMYKEISWE
ncbi:MAG: hypothetical protein AMS27_10930 [Bacteroides sp. SM23_62_1]|nr:MAG: hypothetical protein AMS27_10930 [Bacteroides sp. SM23_62_1]